MSQKIIVLIACVLLAAVASHGASHAARANRVSRHD